MRRYILAYDRILHKDPLKVKMVTSFVIITSSDYTVQALVKRKEGGDKPLDIRRSLIFGLGYGAITMAPVLHAVTVAWSRFLPSTALGVRAVKSSVDLAGPFVFNMSCMIAIQSIAREWKDAQPVERVRANLWPILKAGWCVWWPMNMIMYSSLVPLHYRVLFVNCGSFFWNAFTVFTFKGEHDPEPS